MKKLLFTFFLLGFGLALSAQYKGNIWTFGDSCKIDFTNPQSPIVGTSAVNARGSCCSISGANDSLLFYASTDHPIVGSELWGVVYNKYDSIMERGDSLKGSALYQELVILPKGFQINQFLIFVWNKTTVTKGLWYSEVNMNLNNGTGKIVKKNKAVNNIDNIEGINAIKHGNGKDWWLFTRRFDPNLIGNNDWNVYLVNDVGITDTNIQQVGTNNIANFCKTAVSRDGEHIAFVSNMDLVEIFDFDRCTGIISNPKVAQFQIPFGGDAFSGVEFSPNGKVLYTSEIGNSKIFQYDLTAPNILQTRTIIYHDTSSSGLPFGNLKLAPDNRIYFTRAGCTHLGVIYNPDTLGLSCNFYPDTFYLGGHTSNISFPNNPNYELGPDSGSVCDTLGLGTPKPPHGQGCFILIYTQWSIDKKA